MKLLISVDGQAYEVEVEVAEDDYPQQMQDNRPSPTSATIQSTVLRTPSKPGSSEDPIITKTSCAAVLWPELSCRCRWPQDSSCR